MSDEYGMYESNIGLVVEASGKYLQLLSDPDSIEETFKKECAKEEGDPHWIPGSYCETLGHSIKGFGENPPWETAHGADFVTKTVVFTEAERWCQLICFKDWDFALDHVEKKAKSKFWTDDWSFDDYKQNLKTQIDTLNKILIKVWGDPDSKRIDDRPVYAPMIDTGALPGLFPQHESSYEPDLGGGYRY